MAFAGNVDELALLQTVRIKGAVTPELLATHLGVAPASAQAAFDALVGQGKAAESAPGSIALTPAGLAELEDQLDAERVSIDEDSLADVHESFVPLQARFAEVIASADVERLGALDAEAAGVFDDLSAFVPRLSRYQDLLAEALGKVRAGQTDWIGESGIDSYATVWSELRRELLEAAGRTEDDAA
ncbi:hypothetical protein G4H71_16375 [Rhodococcus triatomae]|uniref:Uncharacterized protein n=1 Tax=Rhodococcus triatomae TaxID=300028 RepID=A0A1G8JMB9_9NOCA|nr:hypothetical protein [Rhodococcus triatomae]QNG21438.1 hypothetical protein G4H72_14000 [Rhodococcus triatomae]QNG25822.1 hypothetical protein G4H71_16375 [Rhodococcus triatomae]SDI32147.1 hypothetical protein SAMN05444695_106225 [Rhodococcus triatomae]